MNPPQQQHSAGGHTPTTTSSEERERHKAIEMGGDQRGSIFDHHRSRRTQLLRPAAQGWRARGQRNSEKPCGPGGRGSTRWSRTPCCSGLCFRHEESANCQEWRCQCLCVVEKELCTPHGRGLPSSFVYQNTRRPLSRRPASTSRTPAVCSSCYCTDPVFPRDSRYSKQLAQVCTVGLRCPQCIESIPPPQRLGIPGNPTRSGGRGRHAVCSLAAHGCVEYLLGYGNKRKGRAPPGSQDLGE